MKKTYINPELLVVKIATQQMLASSPASFDNVGGGEIILDPTEEMDPDSGDEVLGRLEELDEEDF